MVIGLPKNEGLAESEGIRVNLLSRVQEEEIDIHRSNMQQLK
jgi:hypothetical protein